VGSAGPRQERRLDRQGCAAARQKLGAVAAALLAEVTVGPPNITVSESVTATVRPSRALRLPGRGSGGLRRAVMMSGTDDHRPRCKLRLSSMLPVGRADLKIPDDSFALQLSVARCIQSSVSPPGRSYRHGDRDAPSLRVTRHLVFSGCH
jgi:hypothetical protein